MVVQMVVELAVDLVAEWDLPSVFQLELTKKEIIFQKYNVFFQITFIQKRINDLLL